MINIELDSDTMLKVLMEDKKFLAIFQDKLLEKAVSECFTDFEKSVEEYIKQKFYFGDSGSIGFSLPRKVTAEIKNTVDNFIANTVEKGIDTFVLTKEMEIQRKIISIIEKSLNKEKSQFQELIEKQIDKSITKGLNKIINKEVDRRLKAILKP